MVMQRWKEDFSDSGKTVTLDRTRLSQASTNNLRIVTGGLKVFGSLPHHVPITPLFIKSGQSSHRNYRLQVEKEREKEAEKRSCLLFSASFSLSFSTSSSKWKMKKSKFRKKRRS